MESVSNVSRDVLFVTLLKGMRSDLKKNVYFFPFRPFVTFLILIQSIQ